MARRKKKKSDDLKIPEFDETDFMRKEMRHALMMVGTVGLSIFMAVIAGVLTWTLKNAAIPFVLGLLGILLLKFVFDLMKIDTRDMEKMKWAGTGLTYFLTFIAIWVLLINPPIIDLIPPNIQNSTPVEQELGADIGISVTVNDNQGIDTVKVLVDHDGREDGPFNMEKIGRNLYWYRIPDPELGRYNCTIEVTDKGNFFSDAKYHFDVVPHEAPEIALWNLNDGTTVFKGDDIKVQINDNTGVILAWYSLDETYDPADPKADETKLRTKYPITDELLSIKIPKKWQGTNITITVCAMDEVPHNTVCKTYNFPVQ